MYVTRTDAHIGQQWSIETETETETETVMETETVHWKHLTTDYADHMTKSGGPDQFSEYR